MVPRMASVGACNNRSTGKVTGTCHQGLMLAVKQASNVKALARQRTACATAL